MMFKDKTAWFSASCLDSAKNLWVDNGGKFDDVSLASYIFSESLEYEDTKVLYDSDAYLKQHLAVFMSQYVIDAVHQGIDHVLLSKYILIPTCIKNTSKDAQPESLLRARTSNRQKVNSSDSSSSPYLQVTSSSSSDVSSPEKSQPLRQNHDARKASTNQMIVNKVVSTALAGSTSQHRNSCREINTVDTDSIPHIQSLPKVISCLRTIYPGRDGVEVKHVT